MSQNQSAPVLEQPIVNAPAQLSLSLVQRNARGPAVQRTVATMQTAQDSRSCEPCEDFVGMIWSLQNQRPRQFLLTLTRIWCQKASPDLYYNLKLTKEALHKGEDQPCQEKLKHQAETVLESTGCLSLVTFLCQSAHNEMRKLQTKKASELHQKEALMTTELERLSNNFRVIAGLMCGLGINTETVQEMSKIQEHRIEAMKASRRAHFTKEIEKQYENDIETYKQIGVALATFWAPLLPDAGVVHNQFGHKTADCQIPQDAAIQKRPRGSPQSTAVTFDAEYIVAEEDPARKRLRLNEPIETEDPV